MLLGLRAGATLEICSSFLCGSFPHLDSIPSLPSLDYPLGRPRFSLFFLLLVPSFYL